MATDQTIIDRLRQWHELWAGDMRVGGYVGHGTAHDMAETFQDAADALTAAHAALANLPGHTCHVSGDDCGGCEYALERDKRITAAIRERDEARAALAKFGAAPAE